MPRKRNFAVRRGPKNNLWTVILSANDVTATLATSAQPIVASSDWRRGSATSAEMATLLRIRGWVTMVPDQVAGVHSTGSWFSYIMVVDEDAASPPASSVSTYGDEDVIWTSGGAFAETSATQAPVVDRTFIDVKAMRRIKSGQEVRHVMTNLTDGNVLQSNVIRALLRVGGN